LNGFGSPPPKTILNPPVPDSGCLLVKEAYLVRDQRIDHHGRLFFIATTTAKYSSWYLLENKWIPPDDIQNRSA